MGLKPIISLAQTETDALMMPQNKLCIAGLAGYSSWTNYWEGTFKRENANMGAVSTNITMLMFNYGIKNNLNFIVNVPYLQTKASKGTLAGMQGVQDLGFFIKYKPFEATSGNSLLSLYVVGGLSVPSHQYNIDLLPMSIGLGSRVASVRFLGDFQSGKFTASVSGAYLHRSNVTIDRTAYFTDHQINSSEVQMPDAGNFQVRSGYRDKHLIAEAIADNMTTLGGFDIRKNDMPFVSNRMNSTRVGLEAKYYLKKISGLGIHGNYFRTVQGRNVGKATSFMAGVSYILNTGSTSKMD
ncbi:hypothetical protein [Adhaeribacter aquaticus]|uniref:hypothetical protein n=1 Tax=Adhaeribacter aquaticus TaxID=299567 RepID=UPI00040D6AEA|nr:hypothetical protein [Adhaeribacter aquaticus]